eukprot:CAMPEP_0117440598 /NCGR_PEP_ID=MMETSP0759-20121206/3180_1 /TAXON_ID=63605 /ORGANISM="Percolomonas cosmopolitus, Strain WS" /LENGTH=199 /DNA_ID=CAMNT_0005232383 /DNA_START=26 /DNA_END=625 /DNA_ORIENTATION=+
MTSSHHLTKQQILDSVSSGNIKTIQLYFEQQNGTSSSADDLLPDQLLCEACSFGRAQIARYLIEHQNANPQAKNDFGNSPLVFASNSGNVETIRYLVEHCNVPMDQGEVTPLMTCAAQGHLDAVKYFIQKGIDPHAKDDEAFSALLYAAQGGHLNVVRFLIEEVKMSTSDKTEEGQSAVDLAEESGVEEVVEYLKERGI